jgi:hypothetical protein
LIRALGELLLESGQRLVEEPGLLGRALRGGGLPGRMPLLLGPPLPLGLVTPLVAQLAGATHFLSQPGSRLLADFLRHTGGDERHFAGVAKRFGLRDGDRHSCSLGDALLDETTELPARHWT